uniref:Late embryogenesis abundant protein LEA-2 subgroup domain-containing protein n=1 Tax=Leersia perrieri TaxID=77586 RepID=A0A0D9W145_9ORYZ
MAFYEDWCKNNGDCDCSWKKCLIWTTIIAVLTGVIILLIFAFAVVFPPKATANDAVLLRLALSPGSPSPANSTASYNITVTLSLRNPNIYRGINYDPIAVAFSFNGSRFDESATVPAFYHKPRKTATFHLTVNGDGKPVKLTAGGVAAFRAENATGKFGIEMRMDTTMQYKGRKTKCPLAVICPLELQLVDPEVAATAFQRTKCTILRAKKSGC